MRSFYVLQIPCVFGLMLLSPSSFTAQCHGGQCIWTCTCVRSSDSSLFHADASYSHASAKAAGVSKGDFEPVVQISRTWLLTGLVDVKQQ